MDPITIEFQLTKDEVTRLLRGALVRMVRARMVALTSVTLIGGGTALVLTTPRATFEGVLFLIMGAAVLCVSVGSSLAARNQAWRGTEKRGPERVTFSEEGVGVSSGASESRHSWGKFSEVRDQDGFYLFIVNGRVYEIVVPKRAFGSAAEEAEFRSLVDRNLRWGEGRGPIASSARRLRPR